MDYEDDWHDAMTDLPDVFDEQDNRFDEFGYFRLRQVAFLDSYCSEADIPPEEPTHYYGQGPGIHSLYVWYNNKREIRTSPSSKAAAIDYKSYQPQLGWTPIDIIKRTFEKTMQYSKQMVGTKMKKHYKSRFPALNV